VGRRVEVPITPSVLRWAIAESGYTEPEVSSWIDGGEGTLAAWLEGVSRPSLTEMKDVAGRLHRQLATFLLPKPPKVGASPIKFRNSLGDGTRALNPTERRHIRRARRFQGAYAWLATELGRDGIELPACSLSDDPVEAAARVRALLRVSVTRQRDEWKSPSKAFDGWRDALEGLGVLVFLFPMGTSSVRGFSLWDGQAPVVAINSAWKDEARIFSMFHELGHLVTRSSSACAPTTMMTGDSKDKAERWCERFAAALLIPQKVLDEIGNVSDLTSLGNLARKYKVSLSAMALQLIHLNKAKWTLFRVIPKSADTKKAGGGGPARTRRDIQEDQLGKRGSRIFVDAVKGEVIGPSEALDYLDIPSEAFESLVAETGSPR